MKVLDLNGKLAQVWVFVHEHNGSEPCAQDPTCGGIVGIGHPALGLAPMMAGTEERLAQLWPVARDIQKQTGRRITCVRYVRGEEVPENRVAGR